MRDGVELYAALYRPSAGTRFPIPLIRFAAWACPGSHGNIVMDPAV